MPTDKQQAENTFFQTFLNDNETILYVVHKHWWALIVPLAKALALGVILPLFVFWLTKDLESRWPLMTLPWLAFGGVFVARAFLDWYYDVLLLTTDSIIDIHWEGFFSKSSSRNDYETVEGVEYTSKGILSTLFKFGSIEINLNSGETVELPHTADAKKMQQYILEQRNAHGSDGVDHDMETLKRAIKSLLGDEMVKRKHGIAVDELDDENLDEEDDAAYDDEEDGEFFEDDEDDTDEVEESAVGSEDAKQSGTTPHQKKERDVIVMRTRSIPGSGSSAQKSTAGFRKQALSGTSDTSKAKKGFRKKALTERRTPKNAKSHLSEGGTDISTSAKNTIQKNHQE